MAAPMRSNARAQHSQGRCAILARRLSLQPALRRASPRARVACTWEGLQTSRHILTYEPSEGSSAQPRAPPAPAPSHAADQPEALSHTHTHTLSHVDHGLSHAQQPLQTSLPEEELAFWLHAQPGAHTAGQHLAPGHQLLSGLGPAFSDHDPGAAPLEHAPTHADSPGSSELQHHSDLAYAHAASSGAAVEGPMYAPPTSFRLAGSGFSGGSSAPGAAAQAERSPAASLSSLYSSFESMGALTSSDESDGEVCVLLQSPDGDVQMVCDSDPGHPISLAESALLRPIVPASLLQDLEAKLEADVTTLAVTVLFAVGFVMLEWGVNGVVEYYMGDDPIASVACVLVGLVTVFWVRMKKMRLMRIWVR